MQLSDYHPQSKMVTRVTRITQPKFPVIDAHNHLSEGFGGGWDKRPLAPLLDKLDEAGVRLYVDLDGGWGEDILNLHLDHFKAAAPERFQVFGGVDWSAWAEKGDRFGEWAASRLRIQAARGAEGLKIWKNLGLQVKDQHGKLVDVDDARLAPLWETAAELSLPVVIHVADPVSFFDPIDEHNEYYETLLHYPEWHFPSPPYPPFLKIVGDLANLAATHPGTTFIAAHCGCYVENLPWVAKLLDDHPNMYIDIAARVNVLGRQPYSARKFFLQYADRILFGLDLSPDVNAYRTYYRFLETDDEYFDYDGDDPSSTGRWMIYGVFLPDEVLKKVYSLNAEKILLNHRA
jgi:predicted TIM-barrel fold metal-dependent hydrolase